MHVLMVNRYFYPYLGGVEFHILNLTQELLRLGCQVTVACRRRPGESASETFRGICVRRARTLRDLASVLDDSVDVVHVHMPRNAFAFAGLYLARRRGIPTVFTPHCFYPSDAPIKAGLKALIDSSATPMMFRMSDATINLTEQDRRDATSRGLAISRSLIIPNSVRLRELASVNAVDFRERATLPPAFLLHVGRFDAIKHIDFLIRAHRRLAPLGLALIGQDRGTLASARRLVDTLGLTRSVRLLERATFAELCGAYQQASALVMASEYEGLPTVILESMYFGTPVVAAGVGGIPYVVTDGSIGRVYPWGDEDAYVRAVQQVLEAGATDAHRSRDVVAERYSWEANAPKVLALYRTLVERRLADGQKVSQ